MSYSPKSINDAVSNGDNNLIKDYINAGGNVGGKDNNGVGALHVAVAKGKVGLVETLLKAGVNPNAKTKEGTTLEEINRHITPENNKEQISALLSERRNQDNNKNHDIAPPQNLLSGFGTPMNKRSEAAKATAKTNSNTNQHIGQNNKPNQKAGFRR